jgi:hypothetical protein
MVPNCIDKRACITKKVKDILNIWGVVVVSSIGSEMDCLAF